MSQWLNMNSVPLFENTPLREISVPLAGREFSLLLVADPAALAHDGTDYPQGDIYWSELWPSGLALAEAIVLGEIELARGAESVLEVGCGAGLVSIAAAAMLGKSAPAPEIPAIHASDREIKALNLAKENARRNNVTPWIRTLQSDWTKPAKRRYRQIFAADCLYMPDSGWLLSAFLRDSLEQDPAAEARAIVVDPERWSARNFVFVAQEAGLKVRTWRRAVPLVKAHGPVEEIRTPASLSTPPVDVVFYELRLQS